jgi:phosphoglucomutase
MELLTGNQIGSLLAYYRVRTLFDLGVLNKENASRAVIIKTFVTTDLQKAIAEHFGLRCVETLTGFKYIGAKLGKYEKALPTDVQKSLLRLVRGRNPTAAPGAIVLLCLWRRRKLRIQRW